MNSCPKITVVTPSLNQGTFIERTIQSVLSQNYPDLEYIIMDGGSTDNTIDILRKYTGKVTWFSEKDAGQTQAINKGLSKASGEIVTFVNTDDVFLPGALERVADIFSRNPGVMWTIGRCKIIDQDSREIRSLITSYKNFLLGFQSFNLLLVSNFISQPATFWRRVLIQTHGLFDDHLRYVMDYEYWLRIWRSYPPYLLKDYLAAFRIHRASKTVSSSRSKEWNDEERQLIEKYAGSGFWLFLHDLHRLLTKSVYAVLDR